MSDAMPRMPRSTTIRVSEAIIAEAVARDSNHCMIADAVKAALPNARFVAVDIQTIRYSDPKTKSRYIFLTPRSVQKAIIDFDQGDRPRPFQFILSSQGVQVLESTAHNMRSATSRASSRKNIKKAHAAVRAQRAKYGKGKLIKSKRGARVIPAIKGGRPPPSTRVRREFGIRSFDR